ncbi:hypothetical protein [Kordia jejudonensis]|uniref:hypothetical protein n=1 Tax=Kordia jejudonensis TaxID=1348245 RepID=UPI000629A14F|nr:hypothetical protein [Kordia jejudonensis]
MISTPIRFSKQLIILALVAFSLQSCVGVRSGGSSGKISKYVEEFFVGDNVFQYFVKPLKYDTDNQVDAFVDATLRNKDKTTDSLTVNFTVSLKTLDEIEQLVIKNSTDVVKISTIKTFFREPAEEEGFYDHRGSIQLPYSQYVDFLLNENHSIEIKTASERISIRPSKKALKAMNAVKNKFAVRIN